MVPPPMSIRHTPRSLSSQGAAQPSQYERPPEPVVYSWIGLVSAGLPQVQPPSPEHVEPCWQRQPKFSPPVLEAASKLISSRPEPAFWPTSPMYRSPVRRSKLKRHGLRRP